MEQKFSSAEWLVGLMSCPTERSTPLPSHWWFGTPACLGGKVSTACPHLTEVPETTNGRRCLHCSPPFGLVPFHHMNEPSSPTNHSAASHLPNAPCTLPTLLSVTPGTTWSSFTVWPKARIQSRISLHGSAHKTASRMFQLTESVSSFEQEQLCASRALSWYKERRYIIAPVKCVTFVKVLDSYELCLFPRTIHWGELCAFYYGYYLEQGVQMLAILLQPNIYFFP